EYVDGALDVWIHFGMPEQTEHYSYVTFYENSPASDDSRIGVKGSFNTGLFLPGFGTGALGVYSTVDEVEAATLDLNPMAGFDSAGGEFFFYGSIEHADEFSFSGSTSARYQVRRILKPCPQPDQVRIKNWETLVKPQITVCSTCPNSSGLEWDGTFPEQDG